MTIKQALDELSKAYPNSAVNIEVSCWRFRTGNYEARYTTWNGVRPFNAPTLEDAVELALAAAPENKADLKTDQEEQHFAHAGELNAISEANS